MKKHHFIIILSFLFLSINGYSQSKLEMTNAHIRNLNANSLHIGDTLQFEFTLANSGTTKYEDSIKVFLHTNL